ncbi:MAG TPA: hypothetical protein VMV27_12200 [Candidatus Binataceae bacterium]|nr:hypothetical protein [Candidatus Binataceae bacterium]
MTAAGPDHDFERKMLLAHLRANLDREALRCVAELRRDALPVNPANVEFRLSQRIVNARPRSAIVPWHLPDEIVAAVACRVSQSVASEG